MMMIDHKMGKIAGVVTAIMVASWAGVVKASEDVNADDWAASCESNNDLLRGVCAGGAANFIDAMIDLQLQGRTAHGHFICWRPPFPSVTSEYYAYAMVAVRYLRSHPSYAEMPAPALMLAAFMRQWPCGEVGPIRKNP